MRDLELQLRAYGGVLDAARSSVVDTADALPLRVRRSFVVAAAAAILVAIAASAIVLGAVRSGDAHRPHVVTPTPSGPLTTSGPTSATTNVRAHLSVLGIGDSVMEGAEGSLRRAIPGIVVDVALSRQPRQAIALLDLYAKAGTLPATVVIDLGTNGRVTPDVLDNIMRAAGDRRVYFVTIRVPRPWENEVNTEVRALPRRWSNAQVIDWHEYSNAHDDWFVADGFHLTTSGQQAYAGVIASTLGVLTPPTTTTTSPTASALGVVATIAEPALPTGPLAVAGGAVWIASELHSPPAPPAVRLERRDPSTAKLLGTINVPQDAVSSIAGDGDTVWVAGGGDGGVPRSMVSRVDVRSGKVVFTKTLNGTVCACSIVAGNAGVWLVGNGSGSAFHLSPSDGHVIGTVHLAGHSTSATEVRARLLVGLDDGTITVIDPSSDRVERSIPLPTIGDPPVETAVAMSPAAIPAVGPDSAIDGLVARAGGDVGALHSPRWQIDSFANTDFAPATIVNVGSFVWSLGADRLEVFSTHAVSSSEFAYDARRRRFTRSPEGFGSGPRGFRNAVAVGDRLWVVYDAGAGETPSIVVVHAPNALP